MVAAHDQKISNAYVIHYPAHGPRRTDPHYLDFETYRRRTRDNAKCAIAVEIGDASECAGKLELHHSHIEFALTNAVNLAHLEHAYPGVSNPDQVGAWVESAENLQWLCVKHHRGDGGVHHAAAADFEASKFVRGLIT